MTRPLRPIAISILGLLLSACSGASPGLPANSDAPVVRDGPNLPTIVLDQRLHFLTVDGSDVVAEPGTYRVEQAGETQLRLVPTEGKEPLLIQAVRTTHEEALSAPMAVAILGEDELPDILHVVLVFPGGKGLDAVGSVSGVRSRALPKPLVKLPALTNVLTESPLLKNLAVSSPITTLAAGYNFTCELTFVGRPVCYGSNFGWALGDGTPATALSLTGTSPATALSLTGTSPKGLSDAVGIWAGGLSSCAIRPGGIVICWGIKYNPQDGTPRPMPIISGALSMAVADNGGGCAIGDSRLQCWGLAGISYGPHTYSFGFEWKAVAIGRGQDDYVCGLAASGRVDCWFRSGSTTKGGEPVYKGNATAIASGPSHFCVVLQNGTVQCQGLNSFGQLGHERELPASRTEVEKIFGNLPGAEGPSTVQEINTAIAVATGSNHTCVLLGDGTVRCWGDNRYGQLGNNVMAPPGAQLFYFPTPVQVVGLTQVMEVVAGGEHTCARLVNRTVKCWGRGSEGQLMNGKRENSPVPVLATMLSRAPVPPASPAPSSPQPIIVDNRAPTVMRTGTWCVSDAKGYYGTDSEFSCGGGRETLRWVPNLPVAGTYEVSIYWPKHSNRSTTVPFTVHHFGGNTVKTFDQKNTGNVWVSHGRYSFPSGTVSYVEVTDVNGPAGADAVQFVRVQ
jgi:hypothetical protein